MDYRREDDIPMTREIPRITGKTYPSDYKPPQTRARRRCLAASRNEDEEDGGGNQDAAQTSGMMQEDPCAICKKTLPEAGRGTTSCGHVFCFECIMEFMVYNEKCLTCKAIVEAIVMTEREDNQFIRQCQPPRPVATFRSIGSGSEEEQSLERFKRRRDIRASFLPSSNNAFCPSIYRLVPEEWDPTWAQWNHHEPHVAEDDPHLGAAEGSDWEDSLCEDAGSSHHEEAESKRQDSAGKGKCSGKRRAKLVSVKVELSDDEEEHYRRSTVTVATCAAAAAEGRKSGKRRATEHREDVTVQTGVMGFADSMSIVKVEPTEDQVRGSEVQIRGTPPGPAAPAAPAAPVAHVAPAASRMMSADAAPVTPAAAAAPFAPSAAASRVMSVAGARAREQHQARERKRRLNSCEAVNDAAGEDDERQRRRERKVERRHEGGPASSAVAEPRRSEAEWTSPAASSAMPTATEASAAPAVARAMDGSGIDNGSEGNGEGNGESDAVRVGGQFAGSPSSPPSREDGGGPVIGWQSRVMGWESRRRR